MFHNAPFLGMVRLAAPAKTRTGGRPGIPMIPYGGLWSSPARPYMGRIPEGLTPVENFDLKRYLGNWYEVARLDNSFERGLSLVTAEYALNEDGIVSVLNRGWDAEAGRWKEARGTAEFSGDPGTGSLKVTFFWPFSGDYHIIDLDREGYRWALVTGSSREYLWILSREPRLDPAVKARLVAKAKEAGFDTEALIWTV